MPMGMIPVLIVKEFARDDLIERVLIEKKPVGELQIADRGG